MKKSKRRIHKAPHLTPLITEGLIEQTTTMLMAYSIARLIKEGPLQFRQELTELLKKYSITDADKLSELTGPKQ